MTSHRIHIFRHITVSNLLFLTSSCLFAQADIGSCKVEMENLAGTYQGECKNGFANGEGEAIGIHRYKGMFKNGLPNGKGTYFFSDTYYFNGAFQDGIKEGKGALHYVRTNMQDSIIMGYWSGDEYRGKVYKTYSFNTSETFDNIDIIPTSQSGNTVVFEISTTTGAPDGTATTLTGKAKSGTILTITDLIPTNNCIVTKVSSNSTTSKSIYSYMLSKFPANLFLTLSNGRTIDLELYKAAKWNIRLYLNQ